MLIKILTECQSPTKYASFDAIKAKRGRLFTPQSKYEFPREL